MIAVLTGDIINSREIETKVWLQKLKEALGKYGINPVDWEIYRGDSFQLKVEVKEALIAALYIKASMKELREVDVRIAIGIGEEVHKAKKVSESNGTAFVKSGEAFEAMKKKSLVIATPDEKKSKLWNMILELAMLTADEWSVNEAETVRITIDNESKTQSEIAKILGKSQGTLSVALKRSGYYEIMKMNKLFQINMV